MKSDLSKGVEKALGNAPACLYWYSKDPGKSVIFDPTGRMWNSDQKMIEAYHKAKLVILTMDVRLADIGGFKQGEHVSADNDPSMLIFKSMKVKSAMALGDTGKAVDERVHIAKLTELGRSLHQPTGHMIETGQAFPGLCGKESKKKFNEVVRWSDPAPENGKQVTEVIFSYTSTNTPEAFQIYREELARLNNKSAAATKTKRVGVVKLYKSSDGWLPASKVSYRNEPD